MGDSDEVSKGPREHTGLSSSKGNKTRSNSLDEAIIPSDYEASELDPISQTAAGNEGKLGTLNTHATLLTIHSRSEGARE